MDKCGTSGIDKVTTSYRPRLKGSSKRVHRWLNSAFGIYCEKNQHLWEDILQPATYAHTWNRSRDSLLPGVGKTYSFSLDLPPAPLSRSSYARELIIGSIEARKNFDRIKADLKRNQREYYYMNSGYLHVPDGKKSFCLTSSFKFNSKRRSYPLAQEIQWSFSAYWSHSWSSRFATVATRDLWQRT